MNCPAISCIEKVHAKGQRKESGKIPAAYAAPLRRREKKRL